MQISKLLFECLYYRILKVIYHKIQHQTNNKGNYQFEENLIIHFKVHNMIFYFILQFIRIPPKVRAFRKGLFFGVNCQVAFHISSNASAIFLTLKRSDEECCVRFDETQFMTIAVHPPFVIIFLIIFIFKNKFIFQANYICLTILFIYIFCILNKYF